MVSLIFSDHAANAQMEPHGMETSVSTKLLQTGVSADHLLKLLMESALASMVTLN
jgi:hypothetical protein